MRNDGHVHLKQSIFKTVAYFKLQEESCKII